MHQPHPLSCATLDSDPDRCFHPKATHICPWSFYKLNPQTCPSFDAACSVACHELAAGVLLGVAGFGIGCHLGNIFGQNGLQRDTAHRAFGIVIVVLAGVQILVGALRASRRGQRCTMRISSSSVVACLLVDC